MMTAKVSPDWFSAAKKRGEKFPALTVYDYPSARLLDEAEIPLLLVGDSLGMVILGYEDTTHVTMDDMVHHTLAVARANPHSLVAADLPFRSYEKPDQALKNARRLLKAGADAVKLEGGEEKAEIISALRAEGIAVMGHIGMLPQSVKEEGGYRIKGRKEIERESLLRDSRALTDAGVFVLVLELVMVELARQITRSTLVPSLGIGSGPDCDGQILVTSDLVGGFPWFKPRFAKSRADTAVEIKRAAREFRLAVMNPDQPDGEDRMANGRALRKML